MRAYEMQPSGGFLFTDNSNIFVHVMILPLLGKFEEARKHSSSGACLPRLYRELCRASRVEALEISSPLIPFQV